MIARLTCSSKDLVCVGERLEALAYEVTVVDKQSIYIYRKDSNSTKVRGDIKSAKEACKFTGTIKVVHGSSTLTV